MEEIDVKRKKKSTSMRGKIAMLLIGLVGIIYWIMGKVEVFIATLGDKQTQDKGM